MIEVDKLGQSRILTGAGVLLHMCALIGKEHITDAELREIFSDGEIEIQELVAFAVKALAEHGCLDGD